MAAAGAIVIMRRKERELRDEFLAAGAVQAISARSLDDMRIDENMALKRLRSRSVVREASLGLFYWDEDVWVALRSMRRRMILLIAGVMLLIFIMGVYGSSQLK